MLKKTITYPGFENDELVDKTKDIYFDIDIVSAARLMASGFEQNLSKIQEEAKKIEQDVALNKISETEGTLMLVEKFGDIFNPFFAVAYNERRGDDLVNKDENGEPLYKKFMQTKGYTVLLIELMQNPDEVINIIEGSMPKNFQNNPQYQAALKVARAESLNF